MVSIPGRPLLSSLGLRSSDHASALLLYESISMAGIYQSFLFTHERGGGVVKDVPSDE